MVHTEKELAVLENIYQNGTRVRQRDLARIVGLSLGMTNSIVKRLVQKGWLTVRKVNNRNILYAVSPAGVEEIADRSYRYLKRTVKNVVYYKETIEDFLKAVREKGYRKVGLVGPSDVDFIIEHACGRWGLAFQRVSPGQAGEGFFLLFSEKRKPSALSPNGEEAAIAGGAEYLSRLLLGARQARQ